MTPETTATSLRPVAESAAFARSLVERKLRAWDCDETLIETTLVVVTELVANVVRHAATDARLELTRQGDTMRVEVSDSSPRSAVVRDTSDPLRDDGGRGLVLVRELSDAWGAEHHGGGKTVWAEWGLDQCEALEVAAAGEGERQA